MRVLIKKIINEKKESDGDVQSGSKIHDSIFQEKATLKIYRRVNETVPFE